MTEIRDFATLTGALRQSLDIVDALSFEIGPTMESRSQPQGTTHETETEGQEEHPSNASSTSSTEQLHALPLWKRAFSFFTRLDEPSEPASPPNSPENGELEDRSKKMVYDSLKDYKPGYPKLAAFINSDPSYVMYRRFGTLHQRVLLQRQDEICELEDNLKSMDLADYQLDAELLMSREKDEVVRGSHERRNLIEKIHTKLKDYDDLLFCELRHQSLERPTRRNWESLWNWIDNSGALVSTEKGFLHNKRDFIHLGQGKQNSIADDAIEKLFTYLNWPILTKLFRTEEQELISETESEHYFSRTRIRTLSNTIAFCVLLICVVVPVIFLFEVNSSNITKLCVVLGFTILFPTILQTFTHIDRHQVFATTLAYCAVLVVFLGNLQSVNCNRGNGPNTS